MRDNFTQNTILILSKRVGLKCSNPKCRKLTAGPAEQANKAVNIGVAAHICAASKGGARYDPDMTQDERKSIDNGIWLCQSCSKLIDNDTKKYTKELLHTWKDFAEGMAEDEVTSSSFQHKKLDNNDIRIAEYFISIIENSNTMYMLKNHDYSFSFERNHLDLLDELVYYYEKPTNRPKSNVLRKLTDKLIKEISEFLVFKAIKGGPTDNNDGWYIIDFEEDQQQCNRICSDIWRSYENFIDSYRQL